jgi:hypothetical protein
MIAQWEKMSTREQSMFTITILLVLIFVSVMTTSAAMGTLRGLDDDVDRLEQTLINYTQQVERSPAVDIAFARITNQHGSQMTKEEIHDGLRREILRLSSLNMPSPGQDSITPGKRIVQWNSLPEGELKTGLVGYREYTIKFTTAQGSFQNFILFLRRLNESPQALRVQQLTLQRNFDSEETVLGSLEVARTVVDGVPDDIVEMMAENDPNRNLISNSSFEKWYADQALFEDWKSIGLVISRDEESATLDTQCLNAKANSDGAMLFQEVPLDGGATYTLSFDMAAQGPVNVQIQDAAGTAYEGGLTLVAETDDTARLYKRYTMEFTVDEQQGKKKALRVPAVTLLKTGATVLLDNVQLKLR